jgi:hypothetical protein
MASIEYMVGIIYGSFKDIFSNSGCRELHKALVLLPSCVPKKVGVNVKGVNQK